MHLRRTHSRMTRRALWRSVATPSPTRSTSRRYIWCWSLARTLIARRRSTTCIIFAAQRIAQLRPVAHNTTSWYNNDNCYKCLKLPHCRH